MSQRFLKNKKVLLAFLMLGYFRPNKVFLRNTICCCLKVIEAYFIFKRKICG